MRVEKTGKVGRRKRERGRVARGENVGLLLFYISLCSHSGAAPEPSKSLIDATKPTRASREDATRVVVCPTFLHNSRAEGGGLVNHARREQRRGTPRGATLLARVTLAIRDPPFRGFIFFIVLIISF